MPLENSMKQIASAVCVVAIVAIACSRCLGLEVPEKIHLNKPSFDIGIGVGFVTIEETYTWDGNAVPGSPTEKWAMPQLLIGGRLPIVALDSNYAIHAVVPGSIMFLVGSSALTPAVVDVPLHLVFKYGNRSTKASRELLGIGIGGGASLMWYRELGIFNIVPAMYVEVSVKNSPVFLKTSVNLGSVSFTANHSFALWSVGLSLGR